MKELQVFKNDEFGVIRTTQDEKGNFLFCGSDVAKALGYSQARKAVERHCRYGTKRTIPHPQNKNKFIDMNFIPESDVYRLIVKSKLPSSIRFEQWLFEIVLPSIRKFGGYITKETLDSIFHDPENLSVFLSNMLSITNENRALKSEVLQLTPKAKYFDHMMDSGLLVNFRETAKEIGVKPRYFVLFLLENKYLYRNTQDVLLPYQSYVEQGLFKLLEFYRYKRKGIQTLVTPQGRQHFLQLYLSGAMEHNKRYV